MTLVGGVLNPGSSANGTVTNTGGALTNNALVLGAGGNDTKVSPSLTTDGIAGINVGSSGVQGTLTLFGTSSSGTIKSAGNSTEVDFSAVTMKLGAAGNYGAISGNTTFSAVNNVILSAGTDVQQPAGNFAFTGGKGQHFKTQSANNDICGTFTVSASTTGSVTFTTNYTATPVVVLTPQTTGLTSWFLSAVSNSGFTVTVAPSGTYTFGYITVGNPN